MEEEGEHGPVERQVDEMERGGKKEEKKGWMMHGSHVFVCVEGGN
jgi:hypothetical protein